MSCSMLTDHISLKVSKTIGIIQLELDCHSHASFPVDNIVSLLSSMLIICSIQITFNIQESYFITIYVCVVYIVTASGHIIMTMTMTMTMK